MSGTRNVRCVGFYYHPRLQAAQDLAELAAERLRSEVPHVWVSAPWDPERSEQHLAETDLLICIGGDGTVLRAARAASRHDVKILGVDMGRQAFLTELTPDQLASHLPRLLEGAFQVEERSMLEASAERAVEDLPAALPALNDVIIGRGNLGQPAYLRIHVNGDPIGVVRADAIVVASATGSTGYSLSAGGPILHPLARSVVLTPVAPHLAAAAPIVLPADASIGLTLGEEHSGMLSVDGQRPYALAPGGGVEVRRSEAVAQLIRFGERPFFAQLGKRLAWLDDRRLQAVRRTGVEPFDVDEAEPA